MSTRFDERLHNEYEERFEAHKDGAPLWGNTPSEILRSRNWRQWCEQARHSTRFCVLCGFPRDPVEDTHPDDRCPTCVAMESALFRSDYWSNLPHER